MKKTTFYFVILLICSGGFAQHIWMLNDGDFDVINPPFNDSLKIYTHNGSRVAAASGFNIGIQIGTPRIIAVTPDGEYCWLTECIPSIVTKLIDRNGQIILQLDKSLSALDVGRNGNVYMLTTFGTIAGDSLLVCNSEGEYLRGTKHGGYDLVVDDNHNAIWVVGQEVKRFTKDLQLLMTVDPIKWAASSVDFAADGTAWLVERAYGTADKDRILHIDTKGTILDSLQNPNWHMPLCVRVDRKKNTVWVAARNGLYRYNPAKAEWKTIDRGKGNTLTIDQFHDLIWANIDNRVKSYNKAGEVQTIISGFNNSDSRIWLAIQKWESTTRIRQQHQAIPQSVSLQQNYPNPFNPKTTLPLILSEASDVRIAVYDILGKRVKTLYNGFLAAGHHQLQWDGRDDSGTPAPTGIYVYRLNDKEGNQLLGKMYLLR